MQSIIRLTYKQLLVDAKTENQKSASLRDIAVLELLFATGVRVSDLCSLKTDNISFFENMIRIYGKGAKERIVQIETPEVLTALTKYFQMFEAQIKRGGYFLLTGLVIDCRNSL